jgi:hypothetical protein
VPQKNEASSHSNDEESSRRRRARRWEPTNTLRPSPAVVNWLFRAVSRLTSDPTPPSAVAHKAAPLRGAPRGVPDKMTRPTTENSVPEEVRARFVRVGRDFHFASGGQAFRDQGNKLVTRTENLAVIRALVDIAVERGWNDITISGTTRFKRDAWRVATLSGIAVRGYRPTDFEKQKLVRDLAAVRQRGRAEPLVDFPQQQRSENLEVAAPQSRRSGRTGSERTPRAPAGRTALEPDRRARQFTGTLLEHGPAPYEFHPQGEPSYFVQIQTKNGPQVLWGKDLERAIRDAKASKGQEIQLRQAGRERVTVKRKERDTSGRVVSEHDVKAHRNQWEVQREAHSEEHANTPNVTAGWRSRERSNWDGALRALKGAQLFADERISDPAQRSAFVNAVREELARGLERESSKPTTRARGGGRLAEPARTLS